MTSPTATARPWATPVRAPRRDPAKKRGHGPGRRVPACATHPPKAGSVSQISASTRHFGDLRQRPTSAPVRASDLRPGCRSGRGRFARGAERSVRRPGPRRRGRRSAGRSGLEPVRPRADRAGRREPCSPVPPALQRVRKARASCRTVCTAAVQRAVLQRQPNSVCNPAVSTARTRTGSGRPTGGPTRCATRRSVRRRSAAARGGSPVRSTGSRDATGADRVDETLGAPGKRRRLRNRSPELREGTPTAGAGARPGPLYGGATASAGSRAGRSTGTVRRRRRCIRSAGRPLKTAGRSAGNRSTPAGARWGNCARRLVRGTWPGRDAGGPPHGTNERGKTRARRSVTPRWTNGEPALGRVG